MPFNEIRGQSEALQIIKAGIESEKIQGGYLFSGPDSVGKKMTAVILSQAINCLSSSQSDACGACVSCKKIENNRHPDVHFISANNGQLKIEDIRQMQKEISLRAYEGKYKVFIIDDAHMLTPEASNCLLKVLEEPPRSSLIILITDKPGMLFKTIISRCKIIKFKPLMREELRQELQNSQGLDKSTAHFLAYFSEGRLGEALRLKGTDIISERNVIIEKLKRPASFNSIELKADDRESLLFTLNILSAWFRDLYLMKYGMPDNEAINFDRKDDLLESLSRFSSLNLERILTAIADTVFYSQNNINTRLLLLNLKAQIWEQ